MHHKGKMTNKFRRWWWAVSGCWRARCSVERVDAVLALHTLVRLGVMAPEEAEEFATAAGLES